MSAKSLPEGYCTCSSGFSLDLFDQNLTIAEVLQRQGEEFDMAVETLLDDLNRVRTSLDEMMLSTIGSTAPESRDVERQLQRASGLCTKTMSRVQRVLAPMMGEMQALLHQETTEPVAKHAEKGRSSFW